MSVCCPGRRLAPGMGLFSAQMMQVMHMNDYPDIPRDKIGDGDRVWPGDGVAPISSILQSMAKAGAFPVLSLELFNKRQTSEKS